jgi:hypothetical protein
VPVSLSSGVLEEQTLVVNEIHCPMHLDMRWRELDKVVADYCHLKALQLQAAKSYGVSSGGGGGTGFETNMDGESGFFSGS